MYLTWETVSGSWLGGVEVWTGMGIDLWGVCLLLKRVLRMFEGVARGAPFDEPSEAVSWAKNRDYF